MLFGNPEGLKTWDESLQIAIDGLRPETRARLDAEAHALGCSLRDAAVVVIRRVFDEGRELPNSDWEWQPYGKDPLHQRREP